MASACLAPLRQGIRGIAVAAYWLYMLPVAVPYALTASGLSLNVASGGGTARLGLYSDADGRPDRLIDHSGDVTLSAGVITSAFSTHIKAGVYWLAVLFSAAPSVLRHASQAMGVDAAAFAPVCG